MLCVGRLSFAFQEHKKSSLVRGCFFPQGISAKSLSDDRDDYHDDRRDDRDEVRPSSRR